MKIKDFLRKIVRHAILSALGQFVFPKAGVHIFCMHKTKNAQESREQFRELVAKLAKAGKLVRVEEAVSMIKNRVAVEKPVFAFTFDDGFVINRRHTASF